MWVAPRAPATRRPRGPGKANGPNVFTTLHSPVDWKNSKTVEESQTAGRGRIRGGRGPATESRHSSRDSGTSLVESSDIEEWQLVRDGQHTGSIGLCGDGTYLAVGRGRSAPLI
ncbi:hypothetical protein EVAR_48428_1 [Eumeta japonica]|uniref:Uncharacterized protein n=1 Tax=Eumeta variegata TaxID=151549 RepID=A0A4C1XU78_EUMVA|nr:hypothetical protein EVAR_48428_1 [Eumeta japonica]